MTAPFNLDAWVKGISTVPHREPRPKVKFKIDRRVPLADKQVRTPPIDTSALDWIIMEIGESAFFNQHVLAVRNHLYKFTNDHPNRKFTIRTMDNGIRVWRIA